MTPTVAKQQTGFGLNRTSSIYFAQSVLSEPINWKVEGIKPFEDIPISPAAAVFSYGLAVFEGLKCHRGEDGRIRLFRVQQHAQRFQNSAQALGMPPFPLRYFEEGVLQVALANLDYIPAYEKGSLYIRPNQIASEPKLGLGDVAQTDVIIYSSPVGSFFAPARTEGLRLRYVKQPRVLAEGLGYAKTAANYANSLQARREWKRRGFDDVLFSNAGNDKLITEGTGANMFVRLKSGEVVTPPLNGQILPGITRQSAIEVMREILDLTVEDREISIEEIAADGVEMFCTGTAYTVMPIRSVDCDRRSIAFKQNALARQVLDILRDIQLGKRKDLFGWNTLLPVKKETQTAV